MPVFGEYETVGEPLFTCNRLGQVRTYWIARRRGTEDKRDFFIKSIAVRAPDAAHARAAPGQLARDPDADFFEGIARLNQTQTAHAELFAPIHSFGQTESELWYATDYYPRRSLAKFYSTSADITHEGLGHVVSCLATACLVLQRITGRSHGNLKASNVLLAGKPAPLNLTQLRLVDAAGSAWLRQACEKHPNSTEPNGSCESPKALDGNGGLEPRELAELRDLCGIGRILLQLVENTPIESPEDYTLPIEFSAPWRALGEHSQGWLRLCNQLLDPNLSLSAISLESVAKNFQPTPRRNGRKTLISALTMLLVAGTSYTLWTQPWKHAAHARTRAAAFVSARPSAPKPLDDSVGGGRRSTIAISSGTRSNTSASPGGVEAALPASVARLASDPREVGSNPGELEGGGEAARTDASVVAVAPENTGSQAAIWAPTVPPSGAPAPGSTGHAQNSETAAINSELPQTSSPAPSPHPTYAAITPAFSITNAQAPFTQERADSSPVNTDLVSPDTSSRRPVARPNSKSASSRTPRVSSQEERNASRPWAPHSFWDTVISRPKLAQVVDPSTQVPAKEPFTAAQAAHMDSTQLDEQLQSLEVEIARVVALRHSSHLFASLDSLEAQYAKANHLTPKTRRRFDLLRAIMARKLPGGSLLRAPNDALPTPPLSYQER